jgi:mitochondrial fission protein ELM1
MHQRIRNQSPLTIWQFLDGRSGHENQVKGLTEAISRNQSVDVFDVRVSSDLSGLKSVLPGRLNFGCLLPSPDVLIGAGHSTHLPMLASKRRFGGQTIVIMKPSLPLALFDLCLIPAHDRLILPARNVIRTEGALNRIRPSTRQDDNRTMMLIGGPSRHFYWSDSSIVKQIQTVICNSQQQWTITTSERTPASFLRLWDKTLPNIPIMNGRDCSSDWLPGQLAQSGTVWVTCDSMSMIYEALTAGARVGLLELQPLAAGRISANIDRLARNSLATPWSRWMEGHPLTAFRPWFSESDRCSHAVLNHCFSRSWSGSPQNSFTELLATNHRLDNNSPQIESLAGFSSNLRLPIH